MVIGRRRPYCIITRIALYWNEQQKTQVSLSCHIIISLNDCTACCRCYRLEYQISAEHSILHWTAAPFSVMWRQCACLWCSCACLSTSLHSILRFLLGCYDLLRSSYNMYCWTECTSAKSTNLLSGLTTAYMYMYVLFTLIQLWSVPEKSWSMTSTAL